MDVVGKAASCVWREFGRPVYPGFCVPRSLGYTTLLNVVLLHDGFLLEGCELNSPHYDGLMTRPSRHFDGKGTHLLSL